MKIVDFDATELCARLASGEVSSVEAVRALLDRADAVDGRVRALVHRFDERALAEAKQADEARQRGELRGPLHGLPITIKESIATDGLAVTLGVKARRGRPASGDAVVVRLLREAGAIVVGKTNVSQLLLFHESDNPLWGRTANPWDLGRVPGGSSGGEAAAIAAGLSFAGVGTDIGGSIRVPAAFTGTAGLKPTVDRWSNLGCFTALMGQEVVRGQCGPMARSARDLALLFRAIDGPAHARLDPAVPPMETADPASIRLDGLRVGVFTDDGYLPAAASLARTTTTAAEALRDAGAEVVPFSPPLQREILDTYFAALSSDGGATIDAQLAGDEVVPQLAQLRKIAGMHPALRRAAAAVMKARRETRVARLLEIVHEKSVQEYWQLTARRSELKRRVFETWQSRGIDLVVCPAHATPALRHQDSGDFSLGGATSMRYNFLNFPAGVVAVGRVKQSEARRAGARDRLEKKAAAVEEGSAGLPLGVQVVAAPYREDRVLAALIAIEARVRDRDDFPRTPVDP
jgi:fatty acid amide hydrolase